MFFYFFFIIFILLQLTLYIKLCSKYNICIVRDNINNRNIIQSAGILIFINVPIILIFLFFNYPHIREIVENYCPRPYIFLINLFIIGLVSFYDDLKNLNFRYRLILQLFISFLSLSIFIFPITGIFPIKAEQLFAILFIIFVVNSSNFYDGLDGMLLINTIFICFVIFITSYYEQQIFISTILAVGLIPLIILLLPLNFPNAKIFIGDAGSISIGYISAIIMIDLLINKLYLIFLIIYIIPAVDVTITIFKKILKKIDPWERLFDYIFLVPTIKYKQKHIKTTIPFLCANLINLISLILYFETNKIYILLFNVITTFLFLFYCSNFKIFYKQK